MADGLRYGNIETSLLNVRCFCFVLLLQLACQQLGNFIHENIKQEKIMNSNS